MIIFILSLLLNLAHCQHTYIEVILDASGSMDGEHRGTLKIAEAKRLMKGFLVSNNGQQNMHTALRVYGSQRTQDCKDSKLFFDFSDHKLNDLITTIETIRPQPLAKTPLARSLEQAAEDIKDKKGKKLIFLVTDGEETCGGDPCKTAKELMRKYDLQIQVIGYGVENAEAIKQLNCIGSDAASIALDSGQLAQALSDLNEKASPRNITVVSPDQHATVRVYEVNSKGKKIALIKSFLASMGVNVPPTQGDNEYLVEVLLDPTYKFPPFPLAEGQKKVLVVQGEGQVNIRFLEGSMKFILVDKFGNKVVNLKSDNWYTVKIGNYNAEFSYPPFVNMEKKDNIIIVPDGKRIYNIDQFGGLYVTVEGKPFLGYYINDKKKNVDLGNFISDQLMVLPVGSYKLKIDDNKIVEDVTIQPNKIQKISIKP